MDKFRTILILLFLIVLGQRVLPVTQSGQSGDASFAPMKSKTTGKIKALVVLIKFADREPYFTPAQVDSFFNQTGYTAYGNNGSIHDYWSAVSQGRVDLNTYVTSSYYPAPRNFDYYDTGGGSGHTHELLDSALNWLDKRGFDFSQLTVDASGNIKGLSFQFVGNSGAKGLWGHSSYHGRNFDGVQTASYQISELGTSEMHLGGICHEQGHMLFGWPDTYDINADNGGSSGCGKFDLMAGGNSDNTGAPSRNPMPPNPYFRFLSGWNDLIPLESLPNASTFNLLTNNWNTYVYRNPDKKGEMFIVEARRKPYRNVDMPGEGVLVWHIDSLIPNNANQQHTENQHYKVSVVQADNRFHLESGVNNGDSFDYFRLGGTNSLTFARTKWWNGALSGLQLRNISNVKDTMTAVIGSTDSSDLKITSTASAGGSISPFGIKYYALNESVTYSIIPQTDFDVLDCQLDGISMGALSNLQLDSLKSNHVINSRFIHRAVRLKNPIGLVRYNYYEGNWSSLPDFSALTPVKTGSLLSLSLNVAGRTNDNFGIRYTGYLKAPEDGEYTFYLTSDDGSRFSIGTTQIVANQCDPETNGKIYLQAGYHPFTFDFFEGQVTESFALMWSGPGLSKRNLTGLVNGEIDATDLNDPVRETMTVYHFDKILYVDLNKSISEAITLTVFGMQGSKLKEEKMQLFDGRAHVSLKEIPSGVYMIQLSDNNGLRISEKLFLRED